MRRLWLSLTVNLVLAGSVSPATVLSRTVEVTIEPDGRVVETHALRVRIDASSDRDDWSPYPILVNDNRKIQILFAGVERADGTSQKLDKKALDTLGLTGEGILHASQKFRTVAFPESPVGSVLVLNYRVELRPYFPADSLSLLSVSPTDSLKIRISGGGAAFRYRIDGPTPNMVVTPVPGGIEITGTKVSKVPKLEYGSRMDMDGPTLRYGWGGPSRWEDVGEWYLGLVGDLPAGGPTVRQEAAGLKGADDRATIQKLVEHVRTKVRYVAVEVGIGGYRPHSPEEVRTKAWGDCKDKATLLIDMLGAAGIEAFPTLILSSNDARVDADFPSADQFNHMIVAIPQTRLGALAGLAVSDGLYFVDPTQEKGGLSWFGSSTQDQNALVIKRGASRIVRTPRLHGGDTRTTDVQMSPRAAGGFEGQARLHFSGDLASAFLADAATRRAEDFRGTAESMLRARLPGGDVKFTEWTRGEGDLPAITFSASVTLGLAPGVRSLVLPSRPLTPPLSTLEGREADIVLDVPVATTRWKVELPQGWCAPRAPSQSVENEIGLFRQKIESDGKFVTIERHTEIRQNWVKKEQFPKLRELILAEHRANARSLRFECEAPAGLD
ncbi:MAG: DUF3857 domain-containing protein [Vicinamibacteria bacterium]